MRVSGDHMRLFIPAAQWSGPSATKDGSMSVVMVSLLDSCATSTCSRQCSAQDPGVSRMQGRALHAPETPATFQKATHAI